MVHATQNELTYLRLSNLAKLAALTEDDMDAKRAVQCRTSEGWEGNRRSVVALAMRYRLHRPSVDSPFESAHLHCSGI